MANDGVQYNEQHRNEREKYLCERIVAYRTEALKLRNILTQLVHYQDMSELEDSNEENLLNFVGNSSPGHMHRLPGHWDHDGSVCRQCESWNAARKLLNEG